KMGNMEGAESACRKAVELNDKDWASWSNLANLLMLQEKFPESYKCFTRALKCKIPAAEKPHIESSIDGMKKIMNARGLTIDGQPLAPPAVTQSAPAPTKAATGKVASTPRKPAPARSNQPTAKRQSGLDAKAYEQWLGDK